MKKISFILLGLIVFCLGAQAQLMEPLNHHYNQQLNRYLEQRSSNMHTAIKPYSQVEVDAIIPFDSIYDFNQKTGYIGQLANKDFVSINKEKVFFALSPIFDVRYAYDMQQKKSVFETAFGAQMKMTAWKKIGIGFSYRKYYGQPVSYVRNRINERKIVPGYRQANNLNQDVIHSQAFEGYVNIRANKHFSIEGGFGKNHWGDGYRSFFLSDNAMSYPYVKLTADFWRIKYVYLFAALKSVGFANAPINERRTTLEFDVDDTKKKYGVFHYLSIDVAKWMQFGFFEGVVWKHEDSTGVRGIDWSYLNPIVFIRPVEFAIGSPDNVILGMNFKFKLGDKNNIYTQLILDDLDIASTRQGKGFYRTKVAWQIGYKSYDLFKVANLDFQTEFNLARPYVFAHKSKEQNYAHVSQSLTHPLGANFWEWLLFVDYRKGRWMAGLDFQWAKYGGDDDSNPNADHQGSNIFVSDFDIDNIIGGDLDSAYGNEFLQGQLNDIANVKVKAAYLLNPTLNMQLGVFVQHRVKKIPAIDFTERNTMFGVQFTTDLFNKYYNF